MAVVYKIMVEKLLKGKVREVEIKHMEDLIYKLGLKIKVVLAEALFNNYTIEKVLSELKQATREFRQENNLT